MNICPIYHPLECSVPVIRFHSLQSRTEFPFGIHLRCDELPGEREAAPQEDTESKKPGGYECNGSLQPFEPTQCHRQPETGRLPRSKAAQRL
jgi:hypothetical protein